MTTTTINYTIYYGMDNALAVNLTPPAGFDVEGYSYNITYHRSRNTGAILLTITDGSITTNTTDNRVEWTITTEQMVSTFDRPGVYWWRLQATSDANSDEEIIAIGEVTVAATGDYA